MENSLQCERCGQTVTTTHPMQTIRAQFIAHLRSHGLTIRQATLEYNRISSKASA